MGELEDDIEKYLKGQLSAGEMHALEKKALHDPFLAEALEGAQTLSAEDFSSDVSQLKQQLVHQQNTRFPLWKSLRIAASVALLLAVSYSIYWFVQSEKPVTLAKDSSSPAIGDQQKKDSTVNDSSATKPAEEKHLLSLNQPAPTKPRATEGPATSNPTKPESSAASGDGKLAGEKAEAPVESPETEVTIEAPSQITDAAKRVDALAEKTKERRKDAEKFDDSKIASGAASTQKRFVITGKVTDAANNEPIPGANVSIKGNIAGAVSDVNGNYQLVTDQPDRDLVFSFIGYESKDVKAASQSPVNVQLSEDTVQFSEVVVGAMRSEKKDDGPPIIQLAEPEGGRRPYKQYLKKNMHYPSQAAEKKIEGNVTVEFTVEANGAVSSFSVVKGLGDGCNEEVIRLVKEGPAWKPSTQDGKAVQSRVQIDVKFKLPR